MPKARRRKETSFESSMTKSVFLYGCPNKGKLSVLKHMEDAFTKLVNEDIRLLAGNDCIALFLVKNDKKSPEMRALEKSVRIEGYNSAYCQSAFDMAVTTLSNRMDSIRLDMYSREQTVFTKSKVLFAMAADHRSKQDMISAMKDIAYKSKTKSSFYTECVETLTSMQDPEYAMEMRTFEDLYITTGFEYGMPELKSVSVPLDSRLMKIEPSTGTAMPYVISISDPFQKNHRIAIPVDTSAHSIHKITTCKMAGTVVMKVRNGKLRIGWAYQKSMTQPKTSKAVGVDTGITDALYPSNGKPIGSMQPAIDFYHEKVETSFAGLSGLRNKKKNISHYLHCHDLPDDVRRSLIEKMDRLDHMIKTADAPYRKNRCYYGMLDHEIRTSVNAYVDSIDSETLTVLEKLDIREFDKCRKINGLFSMFARGKLQMTLMDTLNWHGFDFKEVVPDYTSQLCPVCSNVDSTNRNGKAFYCTCCGHTEDADRNASINIRDRADDTEVLDACEKNKYNHVQIQKELKAIYNRRNEEYVKKHKNTASA